jgi:FkbM family methyltransferase
MIGSLMSSLFRRQDVFSPERVAIALYRGLFEREPDPSGYRDYVKQLRSGRPLERVIHDLIMSSEFRSQSIRSSVPRAPLFTASMPSGYETPSAETPDGMEQLRSLLTRLETAQSKIEARFRAGCAMVPQSVQLALKTQNRFDLENRCHELTNPVYLGNQTALCRILGSYKLYVDTADTGFSSHVLLDGYWEMWLTIFFARHLLPGMTVIDVGANFGYYTLLFGAFVGDAGHVYSIEPNPTVVTRLRRSVELNGLAHRTTIIEGAAGSIHGGEALLFAPHNEPKNACIIASSAISQDAGIIYQVPKVTLDEVTAVAPRIDFVKIDVEGSEEAVIAGLMHTLKRDRPGLILEFNAGRYRDPRGIIDQLQSVYNRICYVDYEGTAVSTTVDQVISDRFGEDWLLYFDQALPPVADPESSR